jgi:hypothetical protein
MIEDQLTDVEQEYVLLAKIHLQLAGLYEGAAPAFRPVVIRSAEDPTRTPRVWVLEEASDGS